MQNKIELPDESKTDPGSNNTPRWVKVFGIIALILVLVFVLLHLTGNSPVGHSSHTQHEEQKP